MLPSLSHWRWTLSNWREMLALKQTNTRPRSWWSSSGTPRGSGGPYGIPRRMILWRKLSGPCRGRGRRAGWRGGCARRAGTEALGVVPRSGTRWRPAPPWVEAGLGAWGAVISGVPSRQRPTTFAASSSDRRRGSARRPRAACAGIAPRPGEACARPCTCRSAERLARSARQPRSGSGAVLVLVAEDELAGRQRPPAAVLLGDAAAVLRRRSSTPPSQAGRSRRRSRSARVRRAAGARCCSWARPAEARSASSRRRAELGVQRLGARALSVAGRGAPRCRPSPSARARWAQHRRGSSRARPCRRRTPWSTWRAPLGGAQRAEPAEVKATLSAVSGLCARQARGRHARHQALQPRAAGAGVVVAEEEVGMCAVGGCRRHAGCRPGCRRGRAEPPGQLPNLLEELRLQRPRVHLLGVGGEVDQSSRCASAADLLDRGLRIGGEEEPGLGLVGRR